jgi:D-alanyl-D-alanine carboxypeptidase
MTGADASFDLYGGGGVVSTVGDLAKFYRALVRGEVFRDPRTLAVMMSVSPSERPIERLDTNAVHLIMIGRHQCWGHTGFWGAIAAYCPSTDIAFAWTQNQNEGLKDGYRVMKEKLAAALEP